MKIKFALSLLIIAGVSSCQMMMKLDDLPPAQKKSTTARLAVVSIISPADLLPDFWLNGADSTKLIPIAPSKTRILSFASSDANAFSLTPTLSTTTQIGMIPPFNGEAIWACAEGSLKIANNKTLFNSLHNGGGFTAYFSLKPIKNKPNVPVGTIFSTNGNVVTNTGFMLAYNDQGSSNRKYTFNVTNGSAKIINYQSPNNITFNANQYNWGKIIFDGIQYKFYANGNLLSTVNKSLLPYSITDASLDPLFFGTGVLYQNALSAYVKNIVVWNRALNDADQASMDEWIASQTQSVWHGEAPVYGLEGQSNIKATAFNSEIASDLTGTMTAHIMGGYTYSNADFFQTLQLGVNQAPIDPSIYHGPEMRFAQLMGNVWLIKTALNGSGVTKLTNQNTSSPITSDWNIGSVNEMGDLRNLNVVHALDDIENEFRYTPVYRGIIRFQGCRESEKPPITPSGSGALWQLNTEDMFKKHIDYVTTASTPNHTGGWPMNKTRIIITRINHLSPTFDSLENANVRAGQMSMGTNGFITYPSYNLKVKSFTWLDTDAYPLNADQLHVSAVGQDSIGRKYYNYLIPFINE